MKIGPVVSEEKSFETVDGRRRLPILKAPLFGSGELKLQATVNSKNMTFFDSSALKHIKHICAHERTVEFLNTPEGD